MITILVLTAIALGLACVVLIHSRNNDPDQLFQPRAAPLTMAVQVICGDCAGDGRLPIRTPLDQTGHCARCGGRSYLLASTVAAHRAEARAEQVRAAQAGPGHGRVIPFEARASRARRPRKMAV